VRTRDHGSLLLQARSRARGEMRVQDVMNERGQAVKALRAVLHFRSVRDRSRPPENVGGENRDGPIALRQRFQALPGLELRVPFGNRPSTAGQKRRPKALEVRSDGAPGLGSPCRLRHELHVFSRKWPRIRGVGDEVNQGGHTCVLQSRPKPWNCEGNKRVSLVICWVA